MRITIYLQNRTGVELRAIVKGTYFESPTIAVAAGGIGIAPNGTSGKKFLLTLYQNPWTAQWEPVEAQVIDAQHQMLYDLAPNGLPTKSSYGGSGRKPTAKQKTSATSELLEY